jgi:phosphoenolpyruvate carboxykinase (GTP)
MSIQDFVAIPLGKYVANNLMFAKKIAKTPKVFGVNYFLRDKEGKFVNGVRDKHVWVKWMELRIHGEAGAIRAPTGLIPLYKDLVPLFRQVLGKEYRTEDYAAQFTIRVPENLAKLDRVETFHREHVPDAPSVLFDVLKAQRARLLDAKARYGDYISPDMMPQETAP